MCDWDTDESDAFLSADEGDDDETTIVQTNRCHDIDEGHQVDESADRISIVKLSEDKQLNENKQGKRESKLNEGPNSETADEQDVIHDDVKDNVKPDVQNVLDDIKDDVKEEKEKETQSQTQNDNLEGEFKTRKIIRRTQRRNKEFEKQESDSKEKSEDVLTKLTPEKVPIGALESETAERQDAEPQKTQSQKAVLQDAESHKVERQDDKDNVKAEDAKSDIKDSEDKDDVIIKDEVTNKDVGEVKEETKTEVQSQIQSDEQDKSDEQEGQNDHSDGQFKSRKIIRLSQRQRDKELQEQDSDSEEKREAVLTKLANIKPQKGPGWGWFDEIKNAAATATTVTASRAAGWSIDPTKFLSAAASLTQQVADNVTSVVESAIGVPSPEELIQEIKQKSETQTSMKQVQSSNEKLD